MTERISRESGGLRQTILPNGLTVLSERMPGVRSVAFGAWVRAAFGPQEYGRVVRTTMIVDPKGVIRHHWPEVIPQGHAKRVREELARLQAGK